MRGVKGTYLGVFFVLQYSTNDDYLVEEGLSSYLSNIGRWEGDNMDSRVNKLISEQKYNLERSKYSIQYFFNDVSVFAKITSRRHVEIRAASVKGKIEDYDSIYDLVSDDITDLEMAVGRYEIAVSKVIQCYGQFDFDYSYEELKGLVDEVFRFHDEISRIASRKAFRD